MKKILLLITLFVIGNSKAENAADKFIQFKKIVSGNKADWFDFMKKSYDEKFDLLKEIHKAWFNFGIENINEWKNNTDCSEAAKDKIFEDQLNKAMQLHKNNIAQFKKLHETKSKEIEQIEQKHATELNNLLSPAQTQPSELKDKVAEIGEKIKTKIAELAPNMDNQKEEPKDTE